MSVPIAIQSPGGEIHYCKDNSNENSNENSEKYDSNNIILIVTSNSEINNYARVVRIICVCDIFKNYLFFINSEDINIFYISCTLISISGYISTYNNNKYGIIIYITYNYINLFIKLINLITISITSNDVIYILTNNITHVEEFILFIDFLFRFLIILTLLKYYNIIVNNNNNILY